MKKLLIAAGLVVGTIVAFKVLNAALYYGIVAAVVVGGGYVAYSLVRSRFSK